jgi:hypothetical protein
MTLEQDFAKIRETANRIGVAGRGAPVLGELDTTALALDAHEALLKVLAALEECVRRFTSRWRDGEVPPGRDSCAATVLIMGTNIG